MKPLFLIPILIFVTTKLLGQVGYPADLYINLKNEKQIPQKQVEIKLHEVKGTTYYALTNINGGAKFKTKRGKKYILDVSNQKAFKEITIPTEGTKPVIENFVFEKPESAALDTTIFKMFKFRLPTDDEVIMKVIVAANNLRMMPGKDVRLVCKELNKVFISKTESGGVASFIIYPGFNYIIGVEEQDSAGVISVPNRGGAMSEAKVFYQPTDIKEIVSNDTIVQQLKKDQGPTTSHVFVNIKLWDMSMRPIPNEDIFMDLANSKTVYKARTDARGVVDFLLPKGKKFSINLKYERDVDIIEHPVGANLHRINIEFNYMGSEKIENFYKTTTRTKEGFLTDFMSPKVQPCKFDPNWIEKTKDGYNVNFPSQSATSPPTAHGNNLYLNSGYYSPEFYSLDKTTGRSNWGARLAENGISASIYVDDVILANTESCTLYALDAKNGNMLWSKWLGPNIYSTPTVSNRKVFAVYPNTLDARYLIINKNLTTSNHFVLAAFDIKTGEIKWQAWVDEEVLAAPVASNNKVYMTSMAGSLYQFDMETGKQLHLIRSKAVTPPTIIDDLVFVSMAGEKDSKVQELAIYNAKDMKLISRVKQINGQNQFSQFGMDAIDRMNYGVGRVTHFKGKNFTIVGGKLFCFDNSGKIAWQTVINNSKSIEMLPRSSTPVIAGGKIIVNNGTKVQIYDPAQGKLIKEFPVNAELFADAIAYNGWIYTGTKKGKIISINTKDPSLTDWPTWSGNAAHNPVVR